MTSVMFAVTLALLGQADAGGRLDTEQLPDRFRTARPASAPPVSPAKPAVIGTVDAALGEVKVEYTFVAGQPGVRLEVSSASLRGIGAAPFSFAGRLRSQDGEWGTWIRGPSETAPRDPYVWTHVYAQWYPATALRTADRGSGHLIARISIFGPNAVELAFKEVPIELARVPALSDAGGP